MKFIELGKTGINAPCIGQGTMGMGGYFQSDTSDDAAFIKSMRMGVDLGMNLIDTAEVYGNGHAEELVGMAVAGIREKVLIATKFSPENNQYNGVIAAAERSLRRLKTDWIDLYQIHWPNPAIPVEETLGAMVKLMEQGKIRAIGVSNFLFADIKRAQRYEDTIATDQLEYNLFDRSIETELLPYCQNNGVTIMAYSPLDQGRGLPNAEKLAPIAEKHGKANSQVILNWLVSHVNVIAIPKSVNPEHIRQNAESADFELDAEDVESINRAFPRQPIEVPTDEIQVVPDEQGNRWVYQNVSDAIENRLGFVPSPMSLASNILVQNGAIKPIRIRKLPEVAGKYAYSLVEGRIRYWAWVIAYNNEKPIPALIYY